MPWHTQHTSYSRYWIGGLLVAAGILAGGVIFSPAAANLAMLGEALAVLLAAVVMVLLIERRALVKDRDALQAALDRTQARQPRKAAHIPHGKALHNLYLNMAAQEDADFIGANDSTEGNDTRLH